MTPLLLDPHFRYRHAQVIHAARIVLGILLAMGVTVGLGVPHGEWASISLLIVMAGLQHHGNIRTRGLERSLGTGLGAVAGLLVILQQSYLGITPLTWLIIAGFCGFCAYYAIGKGGYIALLSAITLVIVAGYGTDPLDVGLWRAVNVLIGIAIALLLSFALPLYATWSWRYKFAEALSGCAEVCGNMTLDQPAANEQQLQAMATISPLLHQLRPLLPWVSKESGVPMSQLDAVQRSLGIVISTIELMLVSRLSVGDADAKLAVQQSMAQLAYALRLGRLDILGEDDENAAIAATVRAEAHSALMRHLDAELERLRCGLVDAPGVWRL